jgi:hypothetical protein
MSYLFRTSKFDKCCQVIVDTDIVLQAVRIAGLVARRLLRDSGAPKPSAQGPASVDDLSGEMQP